MLEEKVNPAEWKKIKAQTPIEERTGYKPCCTTGLL